MVMLPPQLIIIWQEDVDPQIWLKKPNSLLIGLCNIPPPCGLAGSGPNTGMIWHTFISTSTKSTPTIAVGHNVWPCLHNSTHCGLAGR